MSRNLFISVRRPSLYFWPLVDLICTQQGYVSCNTGSAWQKTFSSLILPEVVQGSFGRLVLGESEDGCNDSTKKISLASNRGHLAVVIHSLRRDSVNGVDVGSKVFCREVTLHMKTGLRKCLGHHICKNKRMKSYSMTTQATTTVA